MRKQYIIPGILFAYLCLYGALNTAILFVVPVKIIRFGLASAGVMYFAVMVFLSRPKRREAILLCAMMVMAVLPLTGLGRNEWGITELVVWFSSLELVFLMKRDAIPIETFFKVFLIIYTVHALCTIIFYFTPQLYLEHVVNLYPNQKARLITMYNRGCMAGLANHYSINGNFMVTALIMISSKLLAGCRKKSTIFLLVLFFAALLLTGKRGQLIFGLLTLIIMYCFLLRSHGVSLNAIITRILQIAIVGIVLGGIMFVTAPALSVAVGRLIQSLRSGNIDSGRYALWSFALKQFMAHPVLGIGWKTFKDQASMQLGFGKMLDVHNVYIQLLCETGLVGVSIFYTWFIGNMITAVKCFYAYFKNDLGEHVTKDRYFICFSLGYQIFFLMYCMTGNPLYDIVCMVPYFVSCGIALNYRHKLKYEHKLWEEVPLGIYWRGAK